MCSNSSFYTLFFFLFFEFTLYAFICTDLIFQEIRHAELWVKYRFSCCCNRCNASPPTYVDLVLQETLAHSLNYIDDNMCREEEIRKLTDYVDDAIADYLSVGNPEACCEKLENVLAQGLPDEQLEPIEGKSQANFKLHPLHHLSLAAYTTLASAYRVRANQLLDLHSEMDGDELEALSLIKTSAAYSLLLAGATHHIFLSDSSLIASIANFWMSAGESLLSLARSSLWNSFVKGRLPFINLSSLQSHKCYECSLADEFEANFFGSQAHNGGLENISKQFLNCVSSITPKVWSFLIQGHHLCKKFKDPIDSNWLQKMETSKIWGFQAHSGCTAMDSSSWDEESTGGYEAQRDTNQERKNLFKLGIHCLLYGGFLSSICYGPSSYLTRYIRNLVDGEESLTDNSSHEMD